MKNPLRAPQMNEPAAIIMAVVAVDGYRTHLLTVFLKSNLQVDFPSLLPRTVITIQRPLSIYLDT